MKGVGGGITLDTEAYQYQMYIAMRKFKRTHDKKYLAMYEKSKNIINKYTPSKKYLAWL